MKVMFYSLFVVVKGEPNRKLNGRHLLPCYDRASINSYPLNQALMVWSARLKDVGFTLRKVGSKEVKSCGPTGRQLLQR